VKLGRVGGAIGSLVTAILAVGARLLAAGSEIDGTDRFVQDRDEDLASWVADRSLALERDLAERTEERIGRYSNLTDLCRILPNLT
jgi:hypothetical protein